MPADDADWGHDDPLANAAAAARDAQRNVLANRSATRSTYLVLAACLIVAIVSLISGEMLTAAVGGVFALSCVIGLVVLHRARTKTVDRTRNIATQSMFAIGVLCSVGILVYAATQGTVAGIVVSALLVLLFAGSWLAVARLQKLSGDPDPR